MKNFILFILLMYILPSCKVDTVYTVEEIYQESTYTLRESLPSCYTFNFPVGYPDMKGYYDANPFGNITKLGKHLGSDLNKIGGGNNDFRDTIYSIGCGMVVENAGPLLAILHKTPDSNYPYIISSYYHCDTLFVSVGTFVKNGQPVALVGKKYTSMSHLHFEILTDTTKTLGAYDYEKSCIDPIKFIKEHRNYKLTQKDRENYSN